MAAKNKPLTSVPTNVITGFLGVGKTSAILSLLKNKASSERWAVLVNEFGEIGVDGSIFNGQHSEEHGVFVTEVPGGCMCCAAGLPMQIALNELLRRARPDRLLIEPTGLGHPKEVLQVLSEDHYKGVLDVHKTITLVDARNLTDQRYTAHETFNQQMAVADIVVGNKTDLYNPGDETRLRDYVASNFGTEVNVFFSAFGELDPSLLIGKTYSERVYHNHHHHNHLDQRPIVSEQAFPESGFIKAVNEGEGFVSVGWRLSPKNVFDYDKVNDFVVHVKAERLKAVLITNKGIFSYNKTSDGIQEMMLDEYAESRIEIIAKEELPQWGDDFFSCL
jgi:G3E family GTPase